jgi:hypothetical protein
MRSMLGALDPPYPNIQIDQQPDFISLDFNWVPRMIQENIGGIPGTILQTPFLCDTALVDPPSTSSSYVIDFTVGWSFGEPQRMAI